MPGFQASDIFTHRKDGDFLGRGSYGIVHRCYHNTLRIIAVKVIKLFGSSEIIERDKSEIRKEADILKRTSKSKYVIDYRGIVEFGYCVGLLMEYAPRGDLETLIRNRSVPWLLRLRVAQETASGIVHLHSIYKDRRITHNDLKPSNILLGKDFNVKICDFQGAKLALRTSKVTDGKKVNEETAVFTVHYASPEFLRDNNSRLTRAMDVYSFAMVLYFILTGKHPFEKLEVQSIIFKVGNGCKPHYNAEEVQKVLSPTENRVFETIEREMRKSWNQNPSDRPEIDVIEKTLRGVLEIFPADDVAAVIDEMKAAVPLREDSVVDERITLTEKYSENFPGAVIANPSDSGVKATCSTFSKPPSETKAYGRIKKTIDMSEEGDDFRVVVGEEICIITKNGTYTASVNSKY